MQKYVVEFEKPRAVITEEFESDEQDNRIGGTVQLSNCGGSSSYKTCLCYKTISFEKERVIF